MSLGKKYTCFKCKTKFYDLDKPDPLCPKCGADQRADPNPDPQEILISKYKRPSQSEGSSRPSKKAAVEDDEDEEFDEEFSDENEAAVDEDEDDFTEFDDDTEEPEEEDYD